MGRVKIAIERIENATNRQVTLSKRKSGLFKKCKELSILCDAEVAAIVFSNTRKLYHFPEHAGNVRSTIERYKSVTNCSLQDREANNEEGIYRMREKLRKLEKEKKNMMGEDLALLSQDELEFYEKRIEESLKKVRDRKQQLTMQVISNNENEIQFLQIQNYELQKKLQYLEIYNHELQKKFQESEFFINEVATFINREKVTSFEYKDSYIQNIDPYE